MNKSIVFYLVIVLALNGCNLEEPSSLKSFELSEVEILDGPFYQAQQTGLKYILELDVDRLLAPYLKDAGINPVKKSYGNWENTGLDGHIGGHYLSALSFMYAANGNPKLLERINYMVDRLYICQEKNGNGYVGGIPDGKEMWDEIVQGDIDAGSFSLNHRWVPLYNIHKMYAGLRDVYHYTGNEKAFQILIGLSDWMYNLTKGLTDNQIQKMLLSEHGGLNEVFVDVAELTGEGKYLEMARRFSHTLILDPLIQGNNELTGLHANTQIPKVIGYKRYADATHNLEWAKASKFFWNTVVNKWTISIGGNSVREHFHPIDDFSSMIESNQGPETCNTYNMLRLTKMLFLNEPNSSYVEYFERALYNHILSSEHPTKGGFVYFTPMRPRHYRVYSQPQEGFWCCVGSGLENPGKYGDLIYAHSENDIYVNLFIDSKLTWKEKNITLTQKTEFPYAENSVFQLSLNQPQKFSLKIRNPKWAEDGSVRIEVNGENQKIKTSNNGYIAIKRTWKNDDKISLFFKMTTKLEYLPDSSPWVSIVHGPIVLASISDSNNLDGLWADSSRMGHIANGKLYPIDEAPMLVANANEVLDNITPMPNKPLHFTLNNIVFSKENKPIELKPFFDIHEARYMVYWPIVKKDEFEERRNALSEKEDLFLALEERTVDQIATGEQQPESDHSFKGEKTYSGVSKNNYWRASEDWFSYELNNMKKNASILRITYHGIDNGNTFSIYANGVLLEKRTTDGSHGVGLYDLDYKLTNDILNKSVQNKIVVKFEAAEESPTPGVFYLRLLKSN